MLTNLMLKNYTTFIEETKFDFKATNYKILENTNVGNGRILKGALFIGENASGKTQVLDAIKFLLDLFFANIDIDYSKKSMYTKDKNFLLKYDFLVKNNKIEYEITLSTEKIIKESLYLNDKEIIKREKNKANITYLDKEVEINEQVSIIKQEYYNTRFNNEIILNAWMEYLKSSIYINCLEKKVWGYNIKDLEKISLENYVEKNNISKLNKLLKDLNYNSEVVLMTNDSKGVNIKSKLGKELGLRKKGTNLTMSLNLESAGNQSLMNVLLPISYAIENDCMLIIDEFSSGMHNELEEALIKYFYNNTNDSQLFFATHSTNVLNTFYLRPDQIYSLEFDNVKGTKITRFSDENPRESQNLEKMYLNGVFNGMPSYCKNIKNK